MQIKIGDIVKHAEPAIRPLRDYWLGCGRHSEKVAAKDALDAKMAERGTVTGIQPNKYGGGQVVSVQWNHGPQSETLEYRLEVAQ